MADFNEIDSIFADYVPGLTEEEDYVKASVLVPLVSIDGQEHVLFTVRSEALRHQPGEISFPGGHAEESDATHYETARRECSEELGITEDEITYLGDLDYLISPVGVRLHAFVGRLETTDFKPSSNEVGEIFTVPLDYLVSADPIVATMQVATRPKDNFPFELVPNYVDDWKLRKTYSVFFYSYKGYNIWGLTALILKNFIDVYKAGLENRKILSQK